MIGDLSLNACKFHYGCWTFHCTYTIINKQNEAQQQKLISFVFYSTKLKLYCLIGLTLSDDVDVYGGETVIRA